MYLYNFLIQGDRRQESGEYKLHYTQPFLCIIFNFYFYLFTFYATLSKFILLLSNILSA